MSPALMAQPRVIIYSIKHTFINVDKHEKIARRDTSCCNIEKDSQKKKLSSLFFSRGLCVVSRLLAIAEAPSINLAYCLHENHLPSVTMNEKCQRFFKLSIWVWKHKWGDFVLLETIQLLSKHLSAMWINYSINESI